MTWHQTCICRLHFGCDFSRCFFSPCLPESGCWSPRVQHCQFCQFSPAVFRGAVKLQERPKLRWKYIATPRRVFPADKSIRWESISDFFLQNRAGGVNNGQFEENYYAFLIHLKNLLVILLCFPFEFSFWSLAQPVSRVFPLKRFLMDEKIGAYMYPLPIAVNYQLWETPIKGSIPSKTDKQSVMI